jgi:mutator protein MutT
LNSENLSPPPIHVVAGALIDSFDRVLIAQRPAGKQLAGSWEFPGGKLEMGEMPLLGLARELLEEIGITMQRARPLIRVRHAYPFGEVLLDFWTVPSYRGEPKGLDGQRLRWCTQDELACADLLPADRPIVAALRLPERLRHMFSPHYVIGDRAGDDPRLHGVLCASLEAAIAAAQNHADFLVLRDVLAAGEIVALCRRVPVPVFVRGVALDEAWALGASGVNEIDG